jgi:hypothetical protein
MICRIDAYPYQHANNHSDVVTTRKRKLRQLYAFCDAEDAIPKVTFASLDAPPTSTGEAKFLEVSDILQYVAYSLLSKFEVNPIGARCEI